MSPKSDYSSREYIFNHRFLGDMIVFRGVWFVAWEGKQLLVVFAETDRKSHGMFTISAG